MRNVLSVSPSPVIFYHAADRRRVEVAARRNAFGAQQIVHHLPQVASQPRADRRTEACLATVG